MKEEVKKKIINSAFVRPVDRTVFSSPEIGSTDYIDCKIYMEYVETGRDEAGKSVGVIQPVVRESKTDIDKLINSHAGEVGLKNLIMLYARTGDSSLFNQNRTINSVTGGYVDLTAIPDESASEIFEKIPSELKGDKSMEEFLKSLTKEQFESFIQALASKVEGSTEKKEEVTENVQ